MICIVSNDSVLFGPGTWDTDKIKAILFPLGWTLTNGEFVSPDGVHTPELGGTTPADMGGGVRTLPVSQIDEVAPEGKALSGYVPTVFADRVEMRPVWADMPPAAPAPRTMTKYAFRTRVLTFAERMTLDNSTIPELVTMRNDLAVADVVDLDEVAKYRPVMLATGLASEERIDEIISGVTHA